MPFLKIQKILLLTSVASFSHLIDVSAAKLSEIESTQPIPEQSMADSQDHKESSQSLDSKDSHQKIKELNLIITRLSEQLVKVSKEATDHRNRADAYEKLFIETNKSELTSAHTSQTNDHANPSVQNQQSTSALSGTSAITRWNRDQMTQSQDQKETLIRQLEDRLTHAERMIATFSHSSSSSFKNALENTSINPSAFQKTVMNGLMHENESLGKELNKYAHYIEPKAFEAKLQQVKEQAQEIDSLKKEMARNKKEQVEDKREDLRTTVSNLEKELENIDHEYTEKTKEEAKKFKNLFEALEKELNDATKQHISDGIKSKAEIIKAQIIALEKNLENKDLKKRFNKSTAQILKLRKEIFLKNMDLSAEDYMAEIGRQNDEIENLKKQQETHSEKISTLEKERNTLIAKSKEKVLSPEDTATMKAKEQLIITLTTLNDSLTPENIVLKNKNETLSNENIELKKQKEVLSLENDKLKGNESIEVIEEKINKIKSRIDHLKTGDHFEILKMNIKKAIYLLKNQIKSMQYALCNDLKREKINTFNRILEEMDTETEKLNSTTALDEIKTKAFAKMKELTQEIRRLKRQTEKTMDDYSEIPVPMNTNTFTYLDNLLIQTDVKDFKNPRDDFNENFENLAKSLKILNETVQNSLQLLKDLTEKEQDKNKDLSFEQLQQVRDELRKLKRKNKDILIIEKEIKKINVLGSKPTLENYEDVLRHKEAISALIKFKDDPAFKDSNALELFLKSFNHMNKALEQLDSNNKDKIPGLNEYGQKQKMIKEAIDKDIISFNDTSIFLNEFDLKKKNYSQTIISKLPSNTEIIAPYWRLIDLLELDFINVSIHDFVSKFTSVSSDKKSEYFILNTQTPMVASDFEKAGFFTKVLKTNTYDGIANKDPFKLFREKKLKDTTHPVLDEKKINIINDFYRLKHLNNEWFVLTQDIKKSAGFENLVSNFDKKTKESKLLLNNDIKTLIREMFTEDFLKQELSIHEKNCRILNENLKSMLSYEHINAWDDKESLNLRDQLIKIFRTYVSLHDARLKLNRSNPKIAEFYENKTWTSLQQKFLKTNLIAEMKECDADLLDDDIKATLNAMLTQPTFMAKTPAQHQKINDLLTNGLIEIDDDKKQKWNTSQNLQDLREKLIEIRKNYQILTKSTLDDDLEKIFG